MKSNKIEGIKPFNKFFFRSCYYHQLIAGLASFGISYEDILMGSFVFSEKNFKTNKCYATEYELEKNLGYKNIRCNMTKNRLIQCIDKKRPVIVGVDCFYYESNALNPDFNGFSLNRLSKAAASPKKYFVQSRAC